VGLPKKKKKKLNVDVKNIFALQGHILSTSGNALIATLQLHSRANFQLKKSKKMRVWTMKN
jgi:hypothetical protein